MVSLARFGDKKNSSPRGALTQFLHEETGMFMANEVLTDFARYLLTKYPVPGDLSAKLGSAANGSSGNGQDEPKLRELWELTELSANDFADEVARFYRLPRLGLPELI